MCADLGSRRFARKETPNEMVRILLVNATHNLRVAFFAEKFEKLGKFRQVSLSNFNSFWSLNN